MTLIKTEICLILRWNNLAKEVLFDELDDKIANIETYETSDELRDVLRKESWIILSVDIIRFLKNNVISATYR